jgi:1,2-diacylglycerol 3-alpha-glucosyltransferase
MRIVQVCPFFAPHVGGVETHVEMISAELARRGHEVHVLTSRHQRSLSEHEQDPRGFWIHRAWTLGTVLATPLALGTTRALERLSADVAHLHYPPPLTSYLASRGLRRRGVPVVLTYHCDLYLEGWWGAILTGLYERVLLPPTLDAAGRIVVHTASYARTSRCLAGRPFVAIPSLVDTERFQPREPDPDLRARLGADGRRVLLFVGRLVPHKGLEDLLRALEELPPDVLLVVVGEGPRRETWETLARNRGLSQRVRFLGAVPDADLPRYHALASVVVLPSQNRLEGFGLAVVEAMASGRPVVVADLPGVREVVEAGRDGLLAEPLLPEDLARHCRFLLEDPEAARRMGAEARASALAKYRKELVVDRLEALYQELKGGWRGPH